MNSEIAASRHFRLEKLAQGVYAAIAVEGGWAACNAGIVDLGDETIVFDTFINQDAAVELRGVAERLTSKPVRYVVNSHWHVDHVKGNQAFPAAKIISTIKTAKVMTEIKKRYERELESIRKEVEKDLESVLAGPDDQDKLLNVGYDRGFLQDLSKFKYTIPNLTFENAMVFDGTKREAEVVSYGGGHTISDVLLHLPEEGIVFVGGLLCIGSHPYLVDGNPEELLRILARIEALDANVLVPGHGNVGTPEDISPINGYVSTLKEIVEDVRALGGNQHDAVAKPIPPPFSTWKWRSFYKGNVEFLFQQNLKAS